MKTNHWKRTIAGLLAMSTLFSLSFTAVSAEETTAETTAAATTTTTATTVVEIPETDMPTLSVTEEEAALFKVTPLTIKVGEESVKGLSVSGYKGTDTDVVIPDTLIDKKGNELPVFGIADGAFSGKDTITSVKMPETDTKLEQPAKASLPTCVTPSGMVMLVKPEEQNASLPIRIRVDGSSISVKLVQEQNVSASMVVILSGI